MPNMKNPNIYNPDDFDTKIQADEEPHWDDPMDDGTDEGNPNHSADDDDEEELEEELDPFDDDDEAEANPDADDEENWNDDDELGRWNGELIYGYDREMSETEAAFYGEDRDYDAMNDYYGDSDE